MNDLEKPFRPTKAFFVCWAILAIGTIFVIRRLPLDSPWYASIALVVVTSLFFAFVFWGPVMLASQAKSSGILPTVLFRQVIAPVLGIIIAAMFAIHLLSLTWQSELVASLAAFAISAIANCYLAYRIGKLNN